MREREPEFMVLEYVTITKDPDTELVVAIGGTERAADILQRGGFLSAPDPRGDYHRLPHGLTAEQQRLKATAASHALLTAGHSIHLDPALNSLATPEGDREAAVRYLDRLAERARSATTGTQIAEVLTEIVSPARGLLPLTREVVLSAWNNPSSYQADTDAESGGPLTQLGDSATALSVLTGQIRLARNQAARTPEQPATATTPAQPAQPPASPPGRRR